MPVCRKRVLVGGIVQGVGFRPFLWRRAVLHGLAGWVENGPDGVVAEVEGEAASVDSWLAAIRDAPPPLAVVDRIRVESVPPEPDARRDFVIRDAMDVSASTADANAVVAPDVAACAACLAEVADPANRRHRYPFTSCTDCGPRFTIIHDVPFDRPRTSMRAFPMCAACAAEYLDPADRRFHAQANACPACGPTVWFTRAGDDGGIRTSRPTAGPFGDAAIAAVRDALLAGDVIAIKGLGGFRLVCDATNPVAVENLRRRKERTGKPLAVMVADAGTARSIAEVGIEERRILESRERPIVLAGKPSLGSDLAEAVSPGNDFVGLMLPATPLEHLVCAGMPPLVMTSGNRAEEPIACDNDEAARRLGGLVDGFLMHDLVIVAPCDDSVVRCVVGAAMPIRRSRGFTPLTIRVGVAGPTVLAVGGELKATICLVHGEAAVMSQHVGDMGSIETYDALGRAADHLLRLLHAKPEAVASDLHPGYVSTAWARRFAEAHGIPLVAVQHHEAHVASVMADHAMLDGRIIGVCFDGTGYGRDRTIHGGEFIVAEHGRFRRAAHVAPFPLPGGDASVRHPWRTAIALLHAAGIPRDDRLPTCATQPAAVHGLLERQLSRMEGHVTTSSMGRLFDAVASLAGVRQSITYEAEAAMSLEAVAGRGHDPRDPYDFPIAPPGAAASPLAIDWRPVVASVAADALAGVAAARIADRFHRGVAAMIASVCRRLRGETGIDTVGLTGGVFQNALLVRLTVERLRADGFDILLHERVPPNDGGIALGQAVIAGRLGGRPGRAGCKPAPT